MNKAAASAAQLAKCILLHVKNRLRTIEAENFEKLRTASLNSE